MKLAVGQICGSAVQICEDVKLAGTKGVLLPNAQERRTDFDNPCAVDRSDQCIILEFSDAWGRYWRRVLDLQGAEVQTITELNSPTM
jgi:hypothetical protein